MSSWGLGTLVAPEVAAARAENQQPFTMACASVAAQLLLLPFTSAGCLAVPKEPKDPYG